MKATVTGGAGFIGSNLVRELLARGDEVTIIDNLTSGYRSNVSSEAEFIEADIRDPHAVIRAVRGRDVVFHLGASVGNKRSLAAPVADAEVNVVGTLNVLEAARMAGCRKVVYSSSAAVYGEGHSAPIREDSKLDPATPYAISKLAAERYVTAYAKLHGMPTVALRYFNVYGSGQRFDPYGNVIPVFALAIRRKASLEIFGDGNQTRDFVNVRDVVAANVLAGDSPVEGTFNVGTGVQTSVNDLVQELLQLTGVDVTISHGPPRPGDVHISFASIEAITHALGYRPSVRLAEGLSDYMDWLTYSQAES